MKETLNSLQRCRAVIEGRLPDRVPVCLLNFQNAARLAGFTVGECVLDGDKAAKSQIAYWEEFRHDMIEIENGICVLSEAAGCAVSYADHTPPWVTRPVLNSLDEVDKLREADFDHSPSAQALFKTIKLVAGQLGSTVCIRGDSDQAPFSLAAELLGMEKFFLALMDPAQHAQIHRLLSYTTAQVRRLVRLVMAAGSHYTVIGDSTAGPDVCSPKIYRQFAAPYETTLVHQLRQEGIEIGTHICGNATKIIGDMLATGALYFEVDYKIDRVAVAEAAKGKATIIGTVDPSHLLPLGTPEAVFEKAKEDIRILGQHGRYILGAGCTIPADTPRENILALVKAAQEHGWYDAAGRLVCVEDQSQERLNNE